MKRLKKYTVEKVRVQKCNDSFLNTINKLITLAENHHDSYAQQRLAKLYEGMGRVKSSVVINNSYKDF